MRTPIPVLAEGRDWLVVAKPPGFFVHRQSDADPEELLLLQRVRDQIGRYLHPVHRLDRPASGCVAFALTPARAADIQRALTDGTGTKHYLALVRGEMPPGAVRIDRPLRDEGATRASLTTAEPLASCPEPRCSAVRLQPHTGRYHQLRRHLRGHNHPILGDMQHGDRDLNREWTQQRGLVRLQLHAYHLRLQLDDEILEATCPLYDDMQNILKALPFYEALCEAEPIIGADGGPAFQGVTQGWRSPIPEAARPAAPSIP